MTGETTIGVFGETMLLWIIVLRQSPRRPPAEHVHRQANFLLDELKACLREHFGTDHSTLQLEPSGHRRAGAHRHA